MCQNTFQNWLENVTKEEKAELLSIQNYPSEISERFSLPLAFGTAGMRGEVGLGTFRMNVYTVRRATYGLAKLIVSMGEEAKKKGVVISYDTRRFSYEFAFAAAQVLSKEKISVWLFEDVRPVPMCSFAIRKQNAVAGIMITASHNPKEYNGYKVYGEDGAQMSLESTKKVVEYIDKVKDYFSVPYDNIFLSDIRSFDYKKINDYITVIGKSVDDDYYNQILKLSLSPEAVNSVKNQMKLVYTPIHGAGYKPVMKVFEKMGINASLVEEQAQPDTEFSTVQVPNPENADTLKAAMALGDKIGADVVIGTDPDCDRMGLAVRKREDNKLTLLNGNQIGVLLLDYILTRLKEKNALSDKGAIVKTIVTTTMADLVAKNFNVEVFDVLTGFKFIGEKIKEWEKSHQYEYIFGFEESYGYLRGTHARDKDAVVACMLTAEMSCYYQLQGKNLYDRLLELFQKYGFFYEANTSIVYKGVEGMKDMANVMKRLRQKSISVLGGEKVIFVADYKSLQKVYNETKRIEKISLPQTDALYYGLKDNQFVCIRPSGTEPKLKLYVLCCANSLQASSKKASKIMKDIKKEL